MADTKISDLAAASALTGTEEFPCADGTATSKAATAAQMRDYVAGNLANTAQSGYSDLAGIADPAAPGAGTLRVYAKSVAGRMLPKIIGPSGIDTIMQAGLHGNAALMVAPASGTSAPTTWGGTLTTAATMSLQQTIASANPWQATSRKRFQTSTTAGNASGMRTAYTQWFRGNAAGFGGFFFRAQFGAQINLNGGQKFIGLCASTGAPAAGIIDASGNLEGTYRTTYLGTRGYERTGGAVEIDGAAARALSTPSGTARIRLPAPTVTRVPK